MSDLRELYQEVIIDHSRHPRNYGQLDSAHAKAEGHNPLCGDRLTVYVKLNNEKIEAVCFEGAGCAISMASASLMTESLIGKTLEQAENIFQQFHSLLTERDEMPSEQLGKLCILAGVKEFPMRVKCATLAWHTLNAAIHHQQTTISTE